MPIPSGAQRVPRSHFDIDDIRFQTYKIGIMSYAHYALDGRLCVRRNFGRATYTASVDGQNIGRLFRTDEAAMRAAVKSIRQKNT